MSDLGMSAIKAYGQTAQALATPQAAEQGGVTQASVAAIIALPSDAPTSVAATRLCACTHDAVAARVVWPTTPKTRRAGVVDESQ